MNFDSPRLNMFQCDRCGKHTIAVDVNCGKPPVALICPACGGNAVSMYYPEFTDGMALYAALQRCYYEFYRPDIMSAENAQRLDEGDLLVRRRTEAEPITHGMYWDYIESLKSIPNVNYKTCRQVEVQVRTLSDHRNKSSAKLGKKFKNKKRRK